MGFTLRYLDKNSVRKSLIRATSFIIKSACTITWQRTRVLYSTSAVRVIVAHRTSTGRTSRILLRTGFWTKRRVTSSSDYFSCTFVYFLYSVSVFIRVIINDIYTSARRDCALATESLQSLRPGTVRYGISFDAICLHGTMSLLIGWR